MSKSHLSVQDASMVCRCLDMTSTERGLPGVGRASSAGRNVTMCLLMETSAQQRSARFGWHRLFMGCPCGQSGPSWGRSKHTDDWGAYQLSSRYQRALSGQAEHPENRAEASNARDPQQAAHTKTICFSRSLQMHDIVIGLFVNRYEFGLPV